MYLLRCFAFLSVSISAALFSLSANASELITFSCSWDNNSPINIFVTPANGEATRSDGGRNYEIIKITKWALWLEVYEPNNQAGLKIQMIERAESTNGKGGKWIDIVHSISGNVSPIVGGICWEK
jgi:hypothetical protein